jgi:hypothetical protein
MRSFWLLCTVEARRALSRRAVRALVGIALLGIAITGVAVFAANGDFDPTVRRGDIEVARLTHLWVTGSADGVLGGTLLFLAVGGLIGGATVVGAEWQHGTMVTLCTWEVRRGRLLAARLLTTFVLAVAIALGLIVLFCAALVPTYLFRGTTAGADADFWRTLAAAVARISLLTGLAAVLGGALASIGRRTTLALGVAFAYLAAVEGAIRGLWPARGRWLIGENVAILVSAADLEGATFTRDPAAAAATLGGYAAVLVAAAVLLFRRRDLAAAT